MQVFATRVWGFSPSTWPVIVFGREGDRDSLLKRSKAGDRIVFVATQGEEPQREDRGRLLGLAEIGRTSVNTLDVVQRQHMSPRDFDEQGRCRWSKAIPMVRAWRFLSKPLLKEILSDQLPRHATSQAVLLNEADAQVVMSLDTEPVALPDSKVLQREREFADTLALSQGPTLGPLPVDWEALVGRTAQAPASTYVFRFGQRDVWKVGWAADVKARLAEVNKHIPAEVTGESWKLAFQHPRASHDAAYALEQQVLQRLMKYRTEGERVRCAEKEVTAAWLNAIRG